MCSFGGLHSVIALDLSYNVFILFYLFYWMCFNVHFKFICVLRSTFSSFVFWGPLSIHLCFEVHFQFICVLRSTFCSFMFGVDHLCLEVHFLFFYVYRSTFQYRSTLCPFIAPDRPYCVFVWCVFSGYPSVQRHLHIADTDEVSHLCASSCASVTHSSGWTLYHTCYT